MTRTVETERSTSDVSGGTTLTICSQYKIFEGNRTVVPGAIVLTLVISCPAAAPAPSAPSNKYFIVKAQLTLAISVNGLFLGMYAVKEFFYKLGHPGCGMPNSDPLGTERSNWLSTKISGTAKATLGVDDVFCANDSERIVWRYTSAAKLFGGDPKLCLRYMSSRLADWGMPI